MNFANGRLSIDYNGRKVRMEGELARLKPTQYNLLQHLAQHAGRLVTHEDLLARLWGLEYADATDYLKVHVMHLRRELGDDANNPSIIATDHSVGHKQAA